MKSQNGLNHNTVSKRKSAALLAVFAAAALYLGGCSTVPVDKTVPPAPYSSSAPVQEVEQDWGIKIEGMRLTAGGYMLDFRYRITDADKAAPILDPAKKPNLIDQATGARFIVPAPAKVGSLRPTANNGKPAVGRSYFVIFSNPGMYVKAGNKVTVEIGDFKVANLVVE